jgi:hypothetical protein
MKLIEIGTLRVLVSDSKLTLIGERDGEIVASDGFQLTEFCRTYEDKAMRANPKAMWEEFFRQPNTDLDAK